MPLELDLSRNALVFGGQIRPFARRHSAHFLQCLLRHGVDGGTLSAETYALAVRVDCGQSEPTRALFQRVISDLEATALRLGVELRVCHPPRRRTVGPWWLACRHAISIVPPPPTAHYQASTPAASSLQGVDRIALLQPLPTDQRVQTLVAFLWAYANAESLAYYGHFVGAAELMPKARQFPLSSEALWLTQLREARYLRVTGQHAAAAAVLAAAPAPATLRGGALLQGYTALAQAWVDYHGMDSALHGDWHDDVTPTLVGNVSPLLLAEWQNLRALATRRRIASVLARPQDATQPTIAALHHEALRLFENALFLVLLESNHEKQQAFLINLAYQLQKMVPLGLASVRDVTSCYALSIQYADWFDAGKDAAWDYIFYAQFWLDNAEALATQAQGMAAVHAVMDRRHTPMQESFHQEAMRRLQEGRNPVMIALGQLNYLRYAEHTGDRGLVETRRAALRTHLDAHPDVLFTLLREGHAAHLGWLSAQMSLPDGSPPTPAAPAPR